VTNLDRLRNRVIAPPPVRTSSRTRRSTGKEAFRAGVAFEAVATRSLALRADYAYTDSENTGAGFAGNPVPYLRATASTRA